MEGTKQEFETYMIRQAELYASLVRDKYRLPDPISTNSDHVRVAISPEFNQRFSTLAEPNTLVAVHEVVFVKTCFQVGQYKVYLWERWR